MSDSRVLVLIDADVLIHFFHAEKITLLNELFSERLRVLDIVMDELKANWYIRSNLELIIRLSGIEELAFPTNKLVAEYSKLKKEIGGAGESACLVYCKNYHQIIASSNTTDTLAFCDKHSIAYLTTLDIFTIAQKKELISEEEVNRLIKRILSKGSHLCCN